MAASTSLRRALKLVVCFSLPNMLKAATLIELVRALVLQRYRQLDGLAAFMGLIDDVTQDPATDPAVLMRRLDLKLAYFDKARLIEYLDHTHALSADLEDGDVPAVPALAGVANVTCLIPTSKGRDEEFSIHAPP